MLIECNQGAGFGFTAAERVLFESGCPGDIIKGWAAYHYRFAATKI
jgi:hypothetical protein